MASGKAKGIGSPAPVGRAKRKDGEQPLRSDGPSPGQTKKMLVKNEQPFDLYVVPGLWQI